ncbi:MAG: heparan-alpha-glucosaminide N-acetyltransferase domain-containing protein [Saprospiraceae bacterium]
MSIIFGYLEFTTTSTPTSSPGRIVFIDVLRAYAILMMLQGHFVDTLLDVAYRDTSSVIYNTWLFMRGMTAPVFFTVTGLVFVYLLLRDGRPFQENKRVKKGIRRGFFLLGVGYLLKINFPALLVFQIYPWFWAVDVLHIIGLSLIALIVLAGIIARVGGPLPLWMLLAGILTFFADPFFTENTFAYLPRFLANYITMDYGSNFVIVPWVGFTFFGGALGALLSKRPQLAQGHLLPIALLALGFALHFETAFMLESLYAATQFDFLTVLIHNNYLFWRLGHVFIVMSLFIWVVPRIGKIPALITRIGSETLTVYGAHYVVLYGTWLGVGLSQIIGYRSLSPIPCAIGALLFVLSGVLFIAYIDPIRDRWENVKSVVRKYFKQLYGQLVVASKKSQL